MGGSGVAEAPGANLFRKVVQGGNELWWSPKWLLPGTAFCGRLVKPESGSNNQSLTNRTTPDALEKIKTTILTDCFSLAAPESNLSRFQAEQQLTDW